MSCQPSAVSQRICGPLVAEVARPLPSELSRGVTPVGSQASPPVPLNAVNPFGYPLSCNDLRQMLDFASVMNVGDSRASVGSLSIPMRFVVVHSADGNHACQ